MIPILECNTLTTGQRLFKTSHLVNDIKDVLEGITFISPVEGPYYYGKKYRIDFEYDYTYKKPNETGLPYTVLYQSILCYSNFH